VGSVTRGSIQAQSHRWGLGQSPQNTKNMLKIWLNVTYSILFSPKKFHCGNFGGSMSHLSPSLRPCYRHHTPRSSETSELHELFADLFRWYTVGMYIILSYSKSEIFPLSTEFSLGYLGCLHRNVDSLIWCYSQPFNRLILQTQWKSDIKAITTVLRFLIAVDGLRSTKPISCYSDY